MIPRREFPFILEQRAEMLIAFIEDMPIGVLMPINSLCPGSWSNTFYSLRACLKSTLQWGLEVREKDRALVPPSSSLANAPIPWLISTDIYSLAARRSEEAV